MDKIKKTHCIEHPLVTLFLFWNSVLLRSFLTTAKYFPIVAMRYLIKIDSGLFCGWPLLRFEN